MPDSVVGGPYQLFDDGVGQIAFLVANSRLGKNLSPTRRRQLSGHVSRKLLRGSGELAYDRRRRSWIGESVTTYAEGSPSSVQTRDFAYDGSQIALQFDATSTPGSPVTLTASNLSHRYLWGPAVDQVLADERVALQNGALATDEVLWTLADAQGTIRDVAKVNGTTAAVVDHVIYNSFGGVVNESDPSQGCLFKYTGCPTDPATDIEFHFERPKIAGNVDWLKIDQSSYTSATTNLYGYCGASPTNKVDPTGLDSVFVEPVYQPQSFWQSFFQERPYLESYGTACWYTSAGVGVPIGTAPLLPSIGEGSPLYGTITLYPQFGGGTISLQELQQASAWVTYWGWTPARAGMSAQQYVAWAIAMERKWGNDLGKYSVYDGGPPTLVGKTYDAELISRVTKYRLSGVKGDDLVRTIIVQALLLTNGNAKLAFQVIIDCRNDPVIGPNDDAWACADDFFQGWTQGADYGYFCGSVPIYYHLLKFSDFLRTHVLPRDNPKNPPSPFSMAQWQWSSYGAYVGGGGLPFGFSLGSSYWPELLYLLGQMKAY